MDKRKKKDKISKIARCVRFNCPTNTTMFEGNEVHYFVGKKAVDTLVESKKYGAESKSKKFPDAKTAEYFLQTLLERGLFFRAKKTVLKKKDKDTTESKKSQDGNKSPKIDKKEKEKVEEVGEKEQNEDGGNKEQEEDKKRKKKIKLTFNDLQTFEIETNDVYVWVFDPTPFWKQCVGVLIVLGTIGGCLFPLWPDWLRLGVYYLSLTGIILFGLFLGIALGRHYLWVLPNLLEEYVPGGFFGPKTETKKKDGANKKKKANDEDDEISEEKPLLESKAEPDDGEPVEAKESVEQKEDTADEKNIEEEEDKEESVTDESTSWDKLSENSQRSEENGEQQKD
uniref:Translocation protein SEC62 n=1 Tax=Meloidogyne hapla TaxID=6305 RepID=A0A1I8BF28_MELHA